MTTPDPRGGHFHDGMPDRCYCPDRSYYRPVSDDYEQGRADRERELAEMHPDDRARIFEAYTSPVTTRTWYVDGPYTHGVDGLACVSSAACPNMAGVGPDEQFTGTPAQMVTWLVEHGYTEMDAGVDMDTGQCDDPELVAAWNERQS